MILATLGLVFDSRRLSEFGCGVAITSALFAVAALVRAQSGRRDVALRRPPRHPRRPDRVACRVPAHGGRRAGLPWLWLPPAHCRLRRAHRARRLRPRLWRLSPRPNRFRHVGHRGLLGRCASGAGPARVRPRDDPNGRAGLPLGLHLGGNWVQASVLRLGPTDAPPSALFTAPLTTTQAQQLWSPDLLPHVPYLFVMTTTAILVAFWGIDASERIDPRTSAGSSQLRRDSECGADYPPLRRLRLSARRGRVCGSRRLTRRMDG